MLAAERVARHAERAPRPPPRPTARAIPPPAGGGLRSRPGGWIVRSSIARASSRCRRGGRRLPRTDRTRSAERVRGRGESATARRRRRRGARSGPQARSRPRRCPPTSRRSAAIPGVLGDHRVAGLHGGFDERERRGGGAEPLPRRPGPSRRRRAPPCAARHVCPPAGRSRSGAVRRAARRRSQTVASAPSSECARRDRLDQVENRLGVGSCRAPRARAPARARRWPPPAARSSRGRGCRRPRPARSRGCRPAPWSRAARRWSEVGRSPRPIPAEAARRAGRPRSSTGCWSSSAVRAAGKSSSGIRDQLRAELPHALVVRAGPTRSGETVREEGL